MKATKTVSVAMTLALVATTTAAHAQDVCQAEAAKLSAVSTSHADDQKRIEGEGQGIENDSHDISVSGTVDIKMKEQHWAFDVPQVTVKNQKMALDLPQVTMKPRALSWDMPVTVMVLKQVGQYPEFRCHGFSCSVHWSPIMTKVPTIEMRRQEIKLDIPETKMARTELVMGVPEFRMARQEWFLKVPEVTIRDPKVEAQKLQDRGQALQTKAETLAGAIKAEAAGATSGLYQCYRDDLQGKRAQVAAQFDSAVGQLDATIKAIGAQGGNPASVATDGGTIDLVAQRKQMVDQQAAALRQIDDAILQLGEKQKALTVQVIA